jgi:hypothetical protein
LIIDGLLLLRLIIIDVGVCSLTSRGCIFVGFGFTNEVSEPVRELVSYCNKYER